MMMVSCYSFMKKRASKLNLHSRIELKYLCSYFTAIEVEFNPVTYSVSENDGVATVTLVTSSFSYDFPFSVTLSYSDITALVGSDYEGNIITVDFIAGQASASFDVPIINDTVAELPEEFSITLVSTNVSDRVVIGDDDVATVEIIDDDSESFF